MTAPGSETVSVIVPCHDSRRTITLCIESVLAQTYPHVELVVVDDASTDDTVALAERYDCRVIRLTENSGAGIARNRGIRAARGSVLFFLDSDVALAPDAVANAVRALAEPPGYDAAWGVYGDRPLIDDGIVERVAVLHGHYRQVQPRPVSTGHFAVGAVRRRVVAEIGGFDERLAGQWANEDHELGLRIADRYRVRRALDVVGYHDDEHDVRTVLRKRFGRAVSLVPLVLTQRGLKPEREALHGPAEILTVLLATATAPLTLVSPLLALVPAGLLLWFARLNLPLLAFVRRRAGWRTAVATAGLCYSYALAVGLGAGAGVVRYVLDPAFRQRYRPPVPAV